MLSIASSFGEGDREVKHETRGTFVTDPAKEGYGTFALNALPKQPPVICRLAEPPTGSGLAESATYARGTIKPDAPGGREAGPAGEAATSSRGATD